MEVYKELYVSANGCADGNGSKNSPFDSLEKAIAALSDICPNADGDVIVNLEGRLNIAETITLTPDNMPKSGHNLILRGNNAEIFGGVDVVGWEKYGEKLYRAKLEGVDDVRNLYVNTFPATRARSKYQYKMEEAIFDEETDSKLTVVKVSEKNFPKSFYDAKNMELVANWEWESFRYEIGDIVYNSDSHEYEIIISYGISRKMGKKSRKFYLENDLTLLDEPGEFYFDKNEKYIYYYPYPEVDMNTAHTCVGKKEGFLSVKGTADNLVDGLVISGIRFSCGACNSVSKYGYRGVQSDAIDPNYPQQCTEYDGGADFPAPAGQIRIDFAKNIAIMNCEFIDMGSTILVMQESVSNVGISGNIFRDSSGGAIRIGTSLHARPREGFDVCRNILIQNNVIARVAGEFYNNCAISVYYENNIRILHNLITDVSYSGVSLSWGWESGHGYDCRDMEVGYNHIRRVMGILHDGGCTYTLGEIMNSSIHDNYYEASGDRGLYNDAGSAEIASYNNVINGSLATLQVQQTKYNTHHLRIYNNYADSNTTYKHGQSDTIYVEPFKLFDPSQPLPDEAQRIVDKAGLMPVYRHLAEKAEIPSWHIVRTQTTVHKFFESPAALEIKRIRGIIEAEDYMQGGEGVGFHKTLSPVKNNNKYRPEEVQLDFDPSIMSYIVHMDDAGEWLAYECDIKQDGEYFIDLRLRPVGTTTPIARLYMDGEVLCDVENDKPGSGYADFTSGPFKLSAGRHVLKMEFLYCFFFDALRVYNGNEPPVPDALLYESDADYDEGVIV